VLKAMACLRKHERSILLASVVLACVFATAGSVRAQTGEVRSAHAGHSLAELHDKHRALLVVFRSRVIDAGGGERAIIEDVLKADPHPKGRFRWVHNQLAKKLDKYMRQHGSLIPADGLADAEYVIYFNVVEFRRILDAVYPYGELFVIIKGTPEEQKPPRIVWRANKVRFAGDVMGELIKELKLIRGES
jgi:hypothetical protein